ncbi:hypothetical protein ARMSODRAFT_983872 [Armillaria solidipes]|uniref:Uncharacterized protein n=1 Tax=Armillaria solidipes TaxID=1076256 RepID=A0A2H3B1D4_9AGAR|nr:hypothetical protein ARMSODRAFT_983872 [Armillaria solidipes]
MPLLLLFPMAPQVDIPPDLTNDDKAFMFQFLDTKLNEMILLALLHGLYTGILAVALWNISLQMSHGMARNGGRATKNLRSSFKLRQGMSGTCHVMLDFNSESELIILSLLLSFSLSPSLYCNSILTMGPLGMHWWYEGKDGCVQTKERAVVKNRMVAVQEGTCRRQGSNEAQVDDGDDNITTSP